MNKKISRLTGGLQAALFAATVFVFLGPAGAMGAPYADTVAGVVEKVEGSRFTLKTSEGKRIPVKLTSTTFAEILRNLGEPYSDCTPRIKDLIQPGRTLFASGIFYPETSGNAFEAKHLEFFGQGINELRFEEPDWWIRQVRDLADFYLKAQFGTQPVDYRNYRTMLTADGMKLGGRQETDTLSRLVYGFATAYLMTGEDRFLDAAEKGTVYLRDHMRNRDERGFTYWDYALDLEGNQRILASEFDDDKGAIPLYEQLYALVGPTQTYRITGDPAIREDLDQTIAFFDQCFLDRKKGGYFSHVAPLSFDPRSPLLGKNQAKKNWNSIGDHGPAYLINLWLATGDERYSDRLKGMADDIAAHFPDPKSPFVQERFNEDWTPDRTWGWQMDRAVIGHNLKIAWNLMRVHSLFPESRYQGLARRIAGQMGAYGEDKQRWGWYDVVERTLQPGEKTYRFAWNDRKTWWQQEQGILAYLILAGTQKEPQYLRLARESSAFYNSWFLDHDSDAVYFNVEANGIPYLKWAERLKGSHAMSGYHAFELTYLATAYNNLLIKKIPFDLYFRPRPNAFGGTLRVSPDILPKGKVKIGMVWVEGKEYGDFDAAGLTVKLPKSEGSLHVKVRLLPS